MHLSGGEFRPTFGVASISAIVSMVMVAIALGIAWQGIAAAVDENKRVNAAQDKRLDIHAERDHEYAEAVALIREDLADIKATLRHILRNQGTYTGQVPVPPRWRRSPAIEVR